MLLVASAFAAPVAVGGGVGVRCLAHISELAGGISLALGDPRGYVDPQVWPAAGKRSPSRVWRRTVAHQAEVMLGEGTMVRDVVRAIG